MTFRGASGGSGGGGGSGTVTDVEVVTANGFAGTVANSTTTPAITLTTTVTGILSGNGTAISAASTTGSGAVVLATTPTLITPVLGVATATSINKVAFTAPATAATLTIADGKTLTVSNSLTLAGTDATVMTFPSTSATIARIDAAQTFVTGQIVNGTLRLGTVSSATGQLLLANSASANLTTIQAGNAAAARTYTWPTDFGAAGTVLTDAAGNGTLSWAAASGGITQLTGDVTAGPGSGSVAATLATAQPGAHTWQATQTITPAANTSALISTGYSLTGSNAQSLMDLAGAWNTSGNPVALKIAVTNTASGATSKFASFLAGVAGATEVFAVDKAGTTTAPLFRGAGSSASAVAYGFSTGTPGNSGLYDYASQGTRIAFAANGVFTMLLDANPYLTLKSDLAIRWSSGAPDGTGDVYLFRDAANTLAQRNGTTAQIARGYRTYTDASNYERWALQTGSGYVEVAAETAGTGADDLDVRLTPSGTGGVNLPGGATFLKTRAAVTSGPGASLGTLANAPSAGDPDLWIPININGVAHWFPAWAA